MLVYLIDGFNLVHKIPALKNSPRPCYDLICHIRRHRLTGSRNNRVIIVFDGFNRDGLCESEYTIVFSNDKSADDVIIERAAKEKNKAQLIVISDDRQIRDRVSQSYVKTVRTTEFLKLQKIKKDADMDDKQISYPLQKEITEEMRKYWLGDRA